MSYMVIKKDLFGISKRLKKIDGNLRVVYNTKLNRFEIQRKKFGKYELDEVVPEKVLDVRVINRILSSKSMDHEKLFREIDEYNQRLDEGKSAESEYIRKNKLKEIYKYANLSKDFDPDKSFKDLWI